MSIDEKLLYLPISEIQIDRDNRQRKVINTKGLRDSIAKLGLLNPILVSAGPPYFLVAGERRLTACAELGIEVVPVRCISDLSPIELQIIELEENVKREDLGWKDLVAGVAKIHALHVSLVPTWTMAETAEAISLSPGIISMYLKVWSYWSDEKVQAAGTVREAYNLLGRRESRQAGEALDELMATPSAGSGEAARGEAHSAGTPALRPLPGAPPPPPRVGASPLRPAPRSAILHENFAQWAPRYTGPKFNFLHCDFPYGISVFAGKQGSAEHHSTGGAYDDSEDVFFALLDVTLSHLDTLLSSSAHLMFWYSERHGDALRAAFRSRAPSFAIQTFPLIWHKSDNAGIAPDALRSPRHVYETALLASRGGRNIVKTVSDLYACPTDKRIHTSCKPEPMLRHFFSMLVDENTRMLDPTCGGGSALRAAESLGAGAVLGLEIDEQMCGLARGALNASRNLRGAL